MPKYEETTDLHDFVSSNCYELGWLLYTQIKQRQNIFLFKARHTLGTFEAYSSSGKFELPMVCLKYAAYFSYTIIQVSRY